MAILPCGGQYNSSKLLPLVLIVNCGMSITNGTCLPLEMDYIWRTNYIDAITSSWMANCLWSQFYTLVILFHMMDIISKWSACFSGGLTVKEVLSWIYFLELVLWRVSQQTPQFYVQDTEPSSTTVVFTSPYNPAQNEDNPTSLHDHHGYMSRIYG